MNKHIEKIEDELIITVEQHESDDLPELNDDELQTEVPYSGEYWGKLQGGRRKEIPQGLWDRCIECEETIYIKARQENLYMCPKCGSNYPMPAYDRVVLLSDEGAFKEIDAQMKSIDTLKFEGKSSYVSKLEDSKRKSGLTDAVICGTTALEGNPYALGVMDFRFLGASMGSVVGEKITRITEVATAKKLPLVLVTASGGARMYEGMLSLMQMAKTSAALHRHQQAGLPYIVIMTHPTYAGVTASFASLGDLIVAEPKAMIGFAGPRVIRDTTQATLPEGFQSSEFLLAKGLIDRIIAREKLREELSLILQCFSKAGKPEVKTTPAAKVVKAVKAVKKAAPKVKKVAEKVVKKAASKVTPKAKAKPTKTKK